MACLSLNFSWASPHFDDKLKSPSDVLSFMLMWWTMFTFLISVDWIIKLMDFIRTRDPGPCAAAAGHKQQQIYFIYWLIETKINTAQGFPPNNLWRFGGEHPSIKQNCKYRVLAGDELGLFLAGDEITAALLTPLDSCPRCLEVKRPSNPWKCTFICTQFRYSLLHHLRICRFVTGSCEIGQASSPEVFICHV